MNPTNAITTSKLEVIVGNWKSRASKLEIPSAYAYLLGAYLSDGHLAWGYSPNPTWQVKDRYFADCIGEALGIIGSPFSFRIGERSQAKNPRYYTVWERRGGKLGRWFDDVTPDKDCLPWVPRELVRPLVAGLMDGDGGIYLSPKGSYRLHYSGKQGFVEDFFDLLESLGVQVLDYTYHLNFQVSLGIESFLKAGLCFAMPRKQVRLVGWCRQRLKRPQRPGRGGWAGWEHRAAVAKWYLKNANHLKGPLVPANERIPTGCMTYSEEDYE